jgi:hypothetical protein
MKRTIIIFTVAAALVLSAGLLFAKDAAQAGGGNAGGTKSARGEAVQSQDRLMLQEKDALCFEAKDGKLYEWKNSYNFRLQNLEKEDDEQGLHRYVREIANRYRFGNKSDEEGFVEWVLRNRPWNTEQ